MEIQLHIIRDITAISHPHLLISTADIRPVFPVYGIVAQQEFPLPIIIPIHHHLMVRGIIQPIEAQILPVNVQQDIISLFNISPYERNRGVLRDFCTPVFIKIQEGTLVEHVQPAFPVLHYAQFIRNCLQITDASL